MYTRGYFKILVNALLGLAVFSAAPCRAQATQPSTEPAANPTTEPSTEPTTYPTTRAVGKATTRPALTLTEIENAYAEKKTRAEKEFERQLVASQRERIESLRALQYRASRGKDLELITRVNNLLNASDKQNTTPRRGSQVGNSISWVACEFVVNVWQNGELVDLHKRELQGDIYGATIEKLSTDVRSGDWIVFQLAANRVRWNGSEFFEAAVCGNDQPTLETHGNTCWFINDDPGKSAAFIADFDTGNEKVAQRIKPDRLWSNGIDEYRKKFPYGKGEPIWGDEHLTWIKLRVP